MRKKMNHLSQSTSNGLVNYSFFICVVLYKQEAIYSFVCKSLIYTTLHKVHHHKSKLRKKTSLWDQEIDCARLKSSTRFNF